MRFCGVIPFGGSGMAEKRCRLIVIDGLDGSGKQTQAKLLCDRLRAQGELVRPLSFPDYQSDSSAPVRMYLEGRLGSSPDDVNAYAASCFFAVDRVASYINDWRADCERCDWIIADRYTTSNIIHQMSKLPEEERDSFISWLFDFEYVRLELPAPDLVLFLDVTPAVSQRLLKERYHGDDSKKDIHEKALGYLARCRESAVYACEKLGWRVIRCDDGAVMRSIEDISDEILGIVRNTSHA